MSNKSNEIAAQLRGIKKVLIFVAACYFATSVTNVYFVVDNVRKNTESRLGVTFYEQADTLSKEQDWDELLKIAQLRKVKRPRDPWAYWFSGKAHFERDELDQAEFDLKRAADVDTYFKKFSDNMLKAVEDRRKEKAKPK